MGQANPITFAQLTKVDVEKRLVYGRAAQETPDHSGEVMDYEQSKPNFVKWSEGMNKATGGASNGNIRAMHGNVAAGKVQELVYHDDEKAIDVVAKIVDDNEWNKVLEGVYTGFSIGGSYGARVTKGKFRHYEAIPNEISLVDRPCIPTATFFDIQKADGSVMQKSFQSQQEQDMDTADKQAQTEYEVTGTPEDADNLAKVLSTNGLSIADAVLAVEKSLVAVNSDDIAMSSLVKRYSVDELLSMEKEYAFDLLELEKAAKDVAFADEKNNKYPVENESHIRAAWNYISVRKADAKYTAEDLELIKAKVVAAWKDKIDAAGPDVAAKAEEAGELAKGMYDVARLGELLQALFMMAASAKREALREGDDSPVAAQLDAIAKQVAEIYKTMAIEEADELVEEMGEADQEDAPEMDSDVMQMAFGLTASLVKLAKKGAEVDEDTMQKMHDMVSKMGAKCAVAEKAEAAGDLNKVDAEAELQKAISNAVEPLNKALGDALAKIAVLEAQPAAAKGVLRVVAKEHEAVTEVKKAEVAAVTERDGTVNDVATALKKIHASGGSPLIGIRTPV